MDDDKFPGFQSPEENWSKLPHQLIAALPNFTSQGELMVVLYILRHTWGFQEYDQLKKITIDEFMHGRKTKEGKRMDGGVGMSKGAVVRGLQRAEEHGFIETEKDERDKARVKKYYMLKMMEEDILDMVSQNETPDDLGVSKEDPDVPKEDIGVTKQDSNGPKVVHRSEKETLEKNLQKETEEKESVLFPENSKSASSSPFQKGDDQLTIAAKCAAGREAAGGNHAVPPSAGGDDCAAEAGLVALYEAKGSEAPRRHSGGYIDQVEKLSQVLQDCAVTDPVVARLASQLLVEDKPGMANPYYRPFPAEYADYLGRAKRQIADDDARRVRDIEATEASVAALEQRQAARPPPPQDDKVGYGVKVQLEAQMGLNEFRQYVAPACFTCDDGILHVAAPDEFTRDWLESNLGLTIERALAGVAGGPTGVSFKVDDS
jgi:DNA-binding PadR family transcriptional regulator